MAIRTLVFVVLASLVMMTASYLQNVNNPVVPAGNEATNLQADSSEESPQELETTESDSTVESSKSDAATEDSGESDSSDSAETPAAANGTDEISESAVDAENQVTPRPQYKLYTLGSIASDSSYRYLVTLSSQGATVYRVELNFRDHKNRFRYRDLEYKGGYLGELDCQSTPLGCAIGVVGEGTPAADAGLEAGDIIKSFNGEPVTDAKDFATMLRRTKSGETIIVGFQRSSSDPQSAEVLLTDKPIELLRPEPDFLQEGEFGDPSFRTTIMATTPMQEVWPLLDANMMDGQWQVSNHTDQEISFVYTISQRQIASNEQLAEQNIVGPIKVTKTYRIGTVSDIHLHEEKARDFHFDLTVKIENQSDTPANFTYQLDGPLGTPTETWWYQNKIHGRNTAVGYVAGARDVLGSTGQSDFTFFGGPELVGNNEKTQPEYFWVLKPPAGETDELQSVNYLGVDTQYFNISLLPQVDNDQKFDAYSVLADIVNVEIPDNAREKKLVDCTFKLFKSLELDAGQTYEQEFQIFAGPKEHEILEAYGLEDARSFGWFAIFSKPLCWLLKVFYYMTGQIGYGLPIILLTALVRSFMIPISRRAALNAQMMQYLQPQMKEIADKYKDDMEKRSLAQRNLFKKYNYNPFGGCFMMFLQIPIFIGLYRGLSVDIALRDQPLFPGLSWCSDLSAPDQFWYWKDWLPAFLGDETGWLGPYFNLLPIITSVLFIVQQKLFTPPPTDEQQELMQKMMKYMMIMMGFMFFKVPAGLCLYFITSSLWGIVERKMLPKPELDKSKLDELLDEDELDKTALKKLEKERRKKEQTDALRSAELDEKKKRDKERKKRLKRRDNA